MKLFTLIALSFCLPLIGCATAPQTDTARNNLVHESAGTLDQFKQADLSVEPFLKKAYGYAVFPGIGKGGMGIGGAYGHGVVYEGNQAVGFCDVSQASIGFQLGGQSFAELIAFQTKDALERFKSGNLAFAATASAVAIQAGAAAAAKYENGVAVFTQMNGGLMYEASVGGQKFAYVPLPASPAKAETTARTE